MTIEHQAELYEQVFCGNADAIALANLLGGISQTWDDLTDQDKPVPRDDIHEMMCDALIHLPRNRFYQAHYPVLHTLLEHAIDTWFEANDLEAREELLMVAYTVRSALTPILIRMAYLCGGADHGREAARAIRLAVYHEPWDAYITSVKEVNDVRIKAEKGKAVSPGAGGDAPGAGQMAILQAAIPTYGQDADDAHPGVGVGGGVRQRP